MAKALSAQAVHGLQDVIYVQFKRFSNYLQRGKTGNTPAGEWTQAHDISKAMVYLQADIMGEMTFSRNWSLLTSKENHHVPIIVSDGALAMITVRNPARIPIQTLIEIELQ